MSIGEHEWSRVEVKAKAFEARKKHPKPYTPAWEALANNEARGYCPNIYPCQKCGYPVIYGYCCGSCGDSNPSEK